MKLSATILLAAMAVSPIVASTDGPVPYAQGGPLPWYQKDTALVIIDPQVDFLSPNGTAWGVVGQSVTDNDTVEHISQLFDAAYDNGFMTFISPHWYYPHDQTHKFGGVVEHVMHDLPMFQRSGQLNLTGFEGSGADWMPEFKEAIARDNVIVASPHKIYGPEHNDLMLQLRKQKINTIILGGMSANLCVESHLRTLTENGFEVYVVNDATAGAINDDLGNGYEAALINYRMIASGSLTTEEAVAAMAAAKNPSEMCEDAEQGDEAVVVEKSGGERRFF